MSTNDTTLRLGLHFQLPAHPTVSPQQRFRDTIGETIDSVITCRPEYMLMGMSSETFWGGREGAQHFLEEMEERAGLPVTTGAISVQEAPERRAWSTKWPIKWSATSPRWSAAITASAS